ncbi:hypothetical protein A0H81_01238 [Grifola frondosa]|uniref:MYND-type domain-containing protein n=1 Tax=Grifola frondosa TaxID=5627 RepID=A0A1C7MQS7_GRIFR|nr:hypothetical protein A0H81_01238 [Grifola frondosa]
MVNAVLDVLHKPIFTDYMFDHASSLIIDSIPALYNDKRRSPSMLTFFAALLRSEDLRRRVVALRCIMLLCSPEEEEEHSSDPDLQPFAFVTALKYRSLPSDLAEFADTYGRERCEIFAIDRCHDDYVAMHIQHSIDPDLVKFGRELAAQVLSSQYALPQSLCPCCYHVTADLKAEDGWEDILTRCATALRDNPNSVHSDEDLADVLEWNYLSMHRSKAAHTFAQAAMARNPSFGYFYYASSCSAETSSEKLRIVKKGLKCKELAPWLRAEFLRRAVHSAMFIGVMLQVVAKNEAAAHLFSAYQDAKMLLKASPPDSVHRQQDVDIYILLTLVIEGPKIELTSGVIQSALKELEINDKFMEFINRPTKSTDMLRMLESRKAVVDRLPEALAEWSATLQRADAIMHGGSRNMTLPEPAQKGDTQTLNSWLSNFEDELEKKEHCDDKDDEDGGPSFSELFEEDELALMRCSWCFRPSVVLKKCGRCGIPRYCDSECQKNHWKEHKIVCGHDMDIDLRQDDVATLSDSVHMPS